MDLKAMMDQAVQIANQRWEKALNLPSPKVAFYRSLQPADLDRIAAQHGMDATLQYIEAMEEEARGVAPNQPVSQ